MRRRCVPVVENVTVPVCPVQWALSDQPQPEMPQPAHRSRFTGIPAVVPIRFTGLPDPSTLPSYWTQTESLAPELPDADSRSHVRYRTPLTAVNVTSA